MRQQGPSSGDGGLTEGRAAVGRVEGEACSKAAQQAVKRGP